jgi:hypothetical protein
MVVGMARMEVGMVENGGRDLVENGGWDGGEWRSELAGFRATSRKLKLVLALAGQGEASLRSSWSSF